MAADDNTTPEPSAPQQDGAASQATPSHASCVPERSGLAELQSEWTANGFPRTGWANSNRTANAWTRGK